LQVELLEYKIGILTPYSCQRTTQKTCEKSSIPIRCSIRAGVAHSA